ncbi:response regulator [Rubellimicrobium aerolatum]|uniref:Response regulator n=1 Tax=Rubellimicrobium aerolatum TaxID=490979 RepID=A0ABW0SH51_9RHOB|nr:response regulator [Rubellimicrobium aerolatum]MBP1807713.1 DNA-binding response OmpR family regulator [Rubellimicrobium aerolatum]
MAGSPPTRPLGPACLILVVEDEVFIALDLAATLEEAGYRVLGPAGTVAAALRLLGQERPDAAVLDVNLRGEMVTPVARLLRKMAVPFALASAYGRKEMPEDEALAGAVHLGKPTGPAKLLAALSDLLSGEAD